MEYVSGSLRQCLSLFLVPFWSLAANASDFNKAEHPNCAADDTPMQDRSIGEVVVCEKWTAFTYEKDGRLMCLVASFALASDHGGALVSGSIRPTEHVIGQFGVIFGFEADEFAHGRAEVGGQTFELTRKDQNTWVSQLSDQQRLVGALRKGDVLTVTMPTLSGGAKVIAYPLSGFNDAWNFAEGRCSVGLN